MNPIWVIMPVPSNLQMSLDAIGDCLDQSVPTRVLVINQGSTDEVRDALEREAELKPDRLFIWSHEPPLPSLSATWNRALDCVWETGGEQALVANNDISINRTTIEVLSTVLEQRAALFVSAVAVTREQFEAAPALNGADWLAQWDGSKGGPDFSCFMISKAAHRRLRFDEGYIPAYGEDCCFHREAMLAGWGDRIFSISLPYWHFASGTLKSLTPEKRAALEQRLGQSRRYHEQVWGGPINAERFAVKGDPTSAREGVSTPELQRRVQAGELIDA